jgi:hypothetical protein
VVRGARARRGSWAGLCLAALLPVAACTFDPSGGSGTGREDGGLIDGGPGQPDAEVDISCTPGERLCFGHNLETCNASGDGFVAAESVACSLSCEAGDGEPFCTAASNIPFDDAGACGGSAPALTPASGTVTITASAGVERITCSGDCGSGQSEILRVAALDQGDDPDIAWFCLSRLSIPDGVTVTVDSAVERSIAFVVAGDVSIAGSLVVGGQAATGAAGGLAGPGGGVGGAPAENGMSGGTGGGRCPGVGGGRVGGTGSSAGAGGSGAGHAGIGGDGGNAISAGPGGPGNGTLLAGPGGGGNTCDGDGSLVPLVGGGGGGGGGDGSCGDCGFPGGGGGGALQISARGTFEVSGSLSASGGAGIGDATETLARGGGGGGGAGGGLLLEAPALTLSGAFVVTGGLGALAGAGLGGDGGGTGDRVGVVGGGNGSDADADFEGGAGGGGAAGRVRLNALTAPGCPSGVAPSPSCSANALIVVPDSKLDR